MEIWGILAAIVAAFAGTLLFYRWGFRLFRPETRSHSFFLIFVFAVAVPAALVGYSIWLLTSAPGSGDMSLVLRSMRAIWAACGFTGGALVGLILSAVRRLAGRDA